MASLVAGAAPIFTSRNFVNGDCEIAVSSGDAYKHRMYDHTQDAYWLSVGSADAVSETIEVVFKEGPVAATRTIDFLAILGTNLKNFIVEYKLESDPSWTTVTGLNFTAGVAELSAAYKLVSLATAIRADRLRLTMTHVQAPTTQAEKVVTNLVAAELVFQPSSGIASWKPDYDDSNRRSSRGIDNTISETVMLHSDATYEMRAAAFTFRGVSSSDRSSFKSLKNQLRASLCFPFPGDEPEVFWQGRIRPDSYTEAFLTGAYRSAGYLIMLTHEEMSGG